jgi:phage terminase small subunit
MTNPDKIPSSSELDELSKALTPKQRVLVANVVTRGMNGTDAAKAAGYSDRSAVVTASKNLAKPHVRAYMNALTMSMFGERGTKALVAIDRLMTTAKSEYVQLEAAKDMANRAGWMPPERKQVTVQGDVSVRIELD